jgi:hypothetical protein
LESALQGISGLLFQYEMQNYPGKKMEVLLKYWRLVVFLVTDELKLAIITVY